MNRIDSPIETLSLALGAALWRDLPCVVYADRDWEAFTSWKAEHYDRLPLERKRSFDLAAAKEQFTLTKERRPEARDVTVRMFPQTWGSTALGYGGVGGAAVTTAYTVVVATHEVAAVYFGGSRLAYCVQDWRADANFQNDLKKGVLRSRADARHYGLDLQDSTQEQA